MSEKLLVINAMQFNYKGVFEFDELLKAINKAVSERGYLRHEKEFIETVKPEGKEIFVELRPRKQKTDYFALMIKIRIYLKNITEVKVTVDDLPKTMNQGDIDIIYDAWTSTDYESRWGLKPGFYFLKSFINKYLYRFPLEASFTGEVADDTRYVYDQVRAAMSLYKYKVSASK